MKLTIGKDMVLEGTPVEVAAAVERIEAAREQRAEERRRRFMARIQAVLERNDPWSPSPSIR